MIHEVSIKCWDWIEKLPSTPPPLPPTPKSNLSRNFTQSLKNVMEQGWDSSLQKFTLSNHV